MKRIISTLIKPQEHSLKLQTIRSAFWGFLGKGSIDLFRLAGNLILTRLLFPEAFGLMALANTTLMMINLFSDTGVKTAIIQNPKGDTLSFMNTAWIISICRGSALFLIMIVLAWPLALFYKEPGLLGILLIMSLNPLIMGFENPSLSLFIKKFRVDKLVLFELSLQIVGLISTIILAWIFRNVEAMAVAVVLGGLYRVIGSYIVARPLPALHWDRKSGSEIFNFGKFIFINTMITWAAGNIDIILIGRLLGVDQLAFYNIGKNLAYLTYAVCVQIAAQSYFPAVSSVCKDYRRVLKIYKSTVSVFLLIGIPVTMCLSIFARDIIGLLYDSRYETAYISMLWLSLFTVFRIIGGINGSTLIGLGKPFYETVSNFIGLIIASASLVIGIHFGGLKGAAIGISVSFLITASVESMYLFITTREGIATILFPWLQAAISIALILPLQMLLKQWFVIQHNFYVLYFSLNILSCIVLSLAVYKLLRSIRFINTNMDSEINMAGCKPYEI